jgi:hypothetical protein
MLIQDSWHNSHTIAQKGYPFMKDLHDPSHSIFKESLTRLDDPKGICVDGKKRNFWSVVGLDIHGYKKVGPR